MADRHPRGNELPLFNLIRIRSTGEFAMMWFYGWCAFIASIVLAVPIAAMLEKRAAAGPSTPGDKESDGDQDEVIEEAEPVEEGELAEVEEAEVAEVVEEAEEVMEFGEPMEDFEELR